MTTTRTRNPRVYRGGAAYAIGEGLDMSSPDVCRNVSYAESCNRSEWEKGWALVEWQYDECFSCYWPGSDDRKFILITLTDYTYYQTIIDQNTDKGKKRNLKALQAARVYAYYKDAPYQVHIRDLDDVAYSKSFVHYEDALRLFNQFCELPLPYVIQNTDWTWMN